MGVRLHRNGRLRGWIGERLGGDVALGDRVYRRSLHLVGGLVVLYFVLPSRFFVVAPTEDVLLVALAGVLALEGLRHLAGWELPTIRPFEEHRIASFTWYAIALTVAVLVFPEPVAVVVALGTAIVDPIAGETRLLGVRGVYPLVPLLAYAILAAVVLAVPFGWRPAGVVIGVLATAPLAIAVEFPKHQLIDDDLVMTLVPGAVLTILLVLVPALPTLGG